MIFSKSSLNRLKDVAIILAALLFCAYFFSLIARYGWFFDLFSHFAVQYVIGGVFLSGIFLFYKKWILSIALFVVAMANIYEIRSTYSDPWVFAPSSQNTEPNLTIAHYNKLFRNQNWGAIRAWFTENPQIDVLFVQESGIRTIARLAEFKDIFPYQYPNNAEERFGDVSVLSKYPFEVSEIPVKDSARNASGTRIKLGKPGFQEKVVLYSIHTQVPMRKKWQRMRNQQLFSVAEAIASDPYPYKIFSGDWNITPYSPYFQTVKNISQLSYNDYSFVPKATWPATSLPFFMKIPIDHVLYTPNIAQIEKSVGPALGSDHHMVIASFYIPES